MVTTRFIPLLVIFLIVSLACNGPAVLVPQSADATDDPNDDSLPPAELTKTRVLGVKVSPLSVALNEPVSVKVDFVRGAKPPAPVICSYPNVDGSQTQSQVAVNPPDNKTGGYGSWEFTFMVNQAGTYSVSCWSTGDDNLTSVLTVSKQGGPAVEKNFTSATLSIQWSTLKVTKGDNVNIFTCTDIPITVSADGVLNGECNKPSGSPDQSPVKGVLNGQWDQTTGEVRFNITTTMTVTGSPDTSLHANWKVTFATDSAPGTFSSETEARGTATWTNTCDAAPELGCYDVITHKEAAGEVGWVMKFEE